MATRLFLSRIEQVRLDLSGRWERDVMPGLKITNDTASVLKRIPLNAIPYIGRSELYHLETSDVVLVGDLDSMPAEEADPLDLITMIFLWMSPVFRSMWMVKDNNARLGVSHMVEVTKNGVVRHSNNFPSEQYQKADFNSDPVLFSNTEWKKALELHHQTETHFHQCDSLEHRFLHQKGASRLARAFRFLRAARSSHDCAFRIAECCSCLESLFSTEITELAHRLSERVSIFIAPNPNLRREHYVALKKAYRVRSKVVHGAALSESEINELNDLSVLIDDYLRRVFQKIFNDPKLIVLFESKPDTLDEYFTNSLFPKLDEQKEDS